MIRWTLLFSAFMWLLSTTDTPTSFPSAVISTLAGDSLKVKLTWTQPTDSLGNADSTVYVMRVTKPVRLYANDSVVRAANVRIRRAFKAALTDSLKLAKPTFGDSVIFQGDSIFQCRKGACSVPGSFAFRYRRSWAPPPMTTFQVVTDSF